MFGSLGEAMIFGKVGVLNSFFYLLYFQFMMDLLGYNLIGNQWRSV